MHPARHSIRRFHWLAKAAAVLAALAAVAVILVTVFATITHPNAATGGIHFAPLDHTELTLEIAAVAVVVCVAIAKRPGRRDRHTDPVFRKAARRAAIVLPIGAIGLATVFALLGAAAPTPQAAAPAPFDGTRATTAALSTLMAGYRSDVGLWDTTAGEQGWWQSAVALDDVIHAEEALGTHRYDAVLAHTYAVSQDTYAGKIIRWMGPYYDDSAWWGVTWLDAYTWTGDRRYLDAAQAVADYLEHGRLNTCGGGGIEWATSYITGNTQLNSITNETAAVLDAGLYNATGRQVDLDRAVRTWGWLRSTGLVRPGQLVADHLDASCRPVGVRWSYTQGEAIAAGQALAQATGDAGYLAAADRIAATATTSRVLNPGGVLREPCAPSSCGINGAVFAGPYVSALAHLGGYQTYLSRQASSVYRRDRMAGDRYGLLWSGPLTSPNSGTQASALATLAAATTGTENQR